MLTFIIVYFIIGLTLELIVMGKPTCKDVKKYGAFTIITGMIFMSFMTPILLVCDMIWDATHK